VTEISQKLAQRMAECLRASLTIDGEIAFKIKTGRTVFAEVNAIVAELPEPVDPDLIEARKLVAQRYRKEDCPLSYHQVHAAIMLGEDDATQSVQNCLAAIKRGRELAGEGK
jgi:hypothetical protein